MRSKVRRTRGTKPVAESLELRRARAENQIWRELLSEFREAVTPFAQVIGHSQTTVRMRLLMSNEAAMEKEIDQRVSAMIARKR